MNKTIKHIFIFIFVVGVFSLTLQSSILQICRESKAFKTQSQQSPISEEEEEKSHDSDESVDKDIVYLDIDEHSSLNKAINLFFFKHLQLAFCSTPLDILVPPPKI